MVATAPGTARRVLAIGEVKSTTQPIGTAAVVRLDHLRDLVVPAQPARPRLLLFSRTGFTTDAQRLVAARADVELVDLDRLYRGA